MEVKDYDGEVVAYVNELSSDIRRVEYDAEINRYVCTIPVPEELSEAIEEIKTCKLFFDGAECKKGTLIAFNRMGEAICSFIV